MIPRTAYIALATAATFMTPSPSMSAESRIESVVRVTASPVQYGRTDFAVVLTADWQDPFDSQDVCLDLVLTSPSGGRVVLPAFHVRGPSGRSSVWSARFAAAEAGTYRGAFVLNDGGVISESAPLAFDVAPSASKGFLRTAGQWVMRFDNGEPFRGVGENFCWESVDNDSSGFGKELNENSRFNFEYMFGKLAASGGNFTRIWMCAWGLPIEWKTIHPDTRAYDADEAHFNKSGVLATDRMVEALERSGVYGMLCLGAHVDLREDWERTNYTAANGGPGERAMDFFSNPEARRIYKDKLRFVVARWGWSTHIAAWEFFNEVDIVVEPPGIRPALPVGAIVAWHEEMSAYLASIDPYGHIRTTSVAFLDLPGLNDIPTLDLNQRHVYRATASIPTLIASHQSHGKPYMIGEFGYDWDWKNDFSKFADKMDRDFRQGLWLGMFSPTPVLPMTWWWEFFDERGMTAYYARVRAMSERMLASGGGELEKGDAAWTGGGAVCMSVRAGGALYVLVANSAESDAEGTLTFPAADVERSATLYDTGADSFTPLAPVPAGAGSVQLRVGGLDNAILILEPVPIP